jgi:hypothetical protein
LETYPYQYAARSQATQALEALEEGGIFWRRGVPAGPFLKMDYSFKSAEAPKGRLNVARQFIAG